MMVLIKKLPMLYKFWILAYLLYSGFQNIVYGKEIKFPQNKQIVFNNECIESVPDENFLYGKISSASCHQGSKPSSANSKLYE